MVLEMDTKTYLADPRVADHEELDLEEVARAIHPASVCTGARRGGGWEGG